MTRKQSPPQGRYVVAEGTQVHHEGRVWAAGERLDAPDAVAEQWAARGYVVDTAPVSDDAEEG